MIRVAAMVIAAAVVLANAVAATDGPSPHIASISPAKRLPGEIVDIGGANLGPDARVAFVSVVPGQGRARVGLTAWDDRTQKLRVAVPRLAPGRYKVQVLTLAAIVYGSTLVTVGKAAKRPAIREATRAAIDRQLAAMFRQHGESGWIPAEVAKQLADDAGASKFDDVQDALEAEEAAAIADAERTTGPIARDIVLLAYKSGQPIKKIATAWRHCHAPRPGNASAGAEGQLLALDPKCGAGSKPHSHIVAKMDASAANRDVYYAAERGTKPPRITEHFHTELRFDDGQIYGSPSESSGWYDGTAPLADIFRWIDGHGVALRVRHVLAANVACVVIACTTYQSSCPLALAAPTNVALKTPALSLVASDAVNPAPVPKDSALPLLGGIQ